MRAYAVLFGALALNACSYGAYAPSAIPLKSALTYYPHSFSKENENFLIATTLVSEETLSLNGYTPAAVCNYKTEYKSFLMRRSSYNTMISLNKREEKIHLTYAENKNLSSAVINDLGYPFSFNIQYAEGRVSNVNLAKDTAAIKNRMRQNGDRDPKVVLDMFLPIPTYITKSWRPGMKVAFVADTDGNDFGYYIYNGTGSINGTKVAALDLIVDSSTDRNYGTNVAKLFVDVDSLMPVVFVAETKSFLFKLYDRSCR